MIVAAKDEEANIEACLSSMCRFDYPNLELIVVNDRSVDATGRIADAMAAGNDRLTAVHVSQLREGWFGKNNAMREGVERSTGDWLCFTDADCVFLSPRALTVAMGYAVHNEADFLSVLPAHEMRSFWESVIQPACSGIMMIWFNPLRVNDPRSTAAYANGAFMLMTRACYEAIGGHEAVKTELNEDMHMARRAKQFGLRLRVVSNTDLYTVRMYDSLAATRAGWARIFLGCFGTFRRLVVSMAVVLFSSLLPWLALLLALVLASLEAEPRSAWPILAVTAAAASALQLSVMVRFYRLSHAKPTYGLLYPLGALIGLGALAGAIRRLSGRRTVTWRGTTYRGDRVDPSTPASPTKTAGEKGGGTATELGRGVGDVPCPGRPAGAARP